MALSVKYLLTTCRSVTICYFRQFRTHFSTKQRVIVKGSNDNGVFGRFIDEETDRLGAYVELNRGRGAIMKCAVWPRGFGFRYRTSGGMTIKLAGEWPAMKKMLSLPDYHRVFSLKMPALGHEHVEVNVEGSTLHIQAERHGYGSYQTMIKLPREDYKADEIHASFINIRNDGFFSCHHISQRDCLLASGRRFLHHFHS